MATQTILVVEDEPSIREVVSLYLEQAGFTVTVAMDGEQAQALLAQQLPDLVVLDIMLPKVDGHALTRWLRMMPKPIEAYPALARHHARMAADPAVRRALAAEGLA